MFFNELEMANKQNNALVLITLNIQGLHAPDHRHTLFSWLNCVKANIVALQEMHSISQDEFQFWVAEESSANNNIQQYSVVALYVAVELLFYINLHLKFNASLMIKGVGFSLFILLILHLALPHFS